MAFSEAQRVQIRMYLGYTGVYTDTFYKLEGAITSIQSSSDGGRMPDDSTEQLVVGAMAELVSISASIKKLRSTLHVEKVGAEGLELDTGKALRNLRVQGREQIGILSDVLTVPVLRDFFSGPNFNQGARAALMPKRVHMPGTKHWKF